MLCQILPHQNRLKGFGIPYRCWNSFGRATSGTRDAALLQDLIEPHAYSVNVIDYRLYTR